MNRFIIFSVLFTVSRQDCINEFGTLGQCLDVSVSSIKQNTLTQATRNALNLCFQAVGCPPPAYDAPSFGSLPEGLSNVGEELVARWLELPQSKRTCVRQKYYQLKKAKIEQCMGTPVPDVGDNPAANAYGQAHHQALVNVEVAQRICEKQRGVDLTSDCVTNTYNNYDLATKCQAFQQCAGTTITPACYGDFPTRHAQYCECRKKAFAEDESAMNLISFSPDLGGFQKFSAAAASGKDGLESLAKGVLPGGTGTPDLFSGVKDLFAGSGLTGIFGDQGAAGATTGRKRRAAGTQSNPIFGGLGGLGSLFPGIGGLGGINPPTIPTGPQEKIVTAQSILAECNIDVNQFLVSSKNEWFQRYCGCYPPGLFTEYFCYVHCAQRVQTVDDILNLIALFQGQIKPRAEQSFFCAGCF